jgi:hypothetical protein
MLRKVGHIGGMFTRKIINNYPKLYLTMKATEYSTKVRVICGLILLLLVLSLTVASFHDLPRTVDTYLFEDKAGADDIQSSISYHLFRVAYIIQKHRNSN